MKHWYIKQDCIFIKPNNLMEDWFNDGRVLSVEVNEDSNIIFEEQCDSCFRIIKTKEQAIEMLQEAIAWIEELKEE